MGLRCGNEGIGGTIGAYDSEFNSESLTVNPKVNPTAIIEVHGQCDTPYSPSHRCDGMQRQ